MTGSVGILNVGAGDVKLVFNKDDPAETIRASRIVKDMLSRGYALLVEIGKDEKGKVLYERAYDFDEEKAEYLIADYNPKEETNTQPEKKKTSRTKRVSAEKTNAVAVSRIAGG